MIKLVGVTKAYGTGVSALEEISFEVERGEFVFVVGPTGSGKTTLFRLITRDLLPTTGEIHIGEWDITKLPSNKIPSLRKKVGVIFQDLKLLADRTIFENVILPLQVAGVEKEEAKKKAEDVITLVNIEEHAQKFPIQLSGGELQRTAIARSLIVGPEILLADEPTGNLDPKTGMGIVKLLQEINKNGTTIIMATHNVEIVDALGKRVIALEKGKLMRDEKKGKYAHSS